MKPKEALSSPRFYTYHTEDSFNPSPDPVERFLKIGALDIYSTDQAIIDNMEARKHIVKIVPEPIATPAMVYIFGTSFESEQEKFINFIVYT
ncbi:MAG: hypothetical protein MUC93_13175 [Bacteroidales bacterium]|nr:hypothetical protein [Bacteroidales bacterium]